MDPLTTLKNATRTLQEAHTQMHHANEALNEARRDLAEAEAKHTLAGLEGKNAEARKAELAALTRKEQASVDNADMNYRKAQIELTYAELDYKFAREAAAQRRAELLASAPQEALA